MFSTSGQKFSSRGIADDREWCAMVAGPSLFMYRGRSGKRLLFDSSRAPSTTTSNSSRLPQTQANSQSVCISIAGHPPKADCRRSSCCAGVFVVPRMPNAWVLLAAIVRAFGSDHQNSCDVATPQYYRDFVGRKQFLSD